MNNTQNTTSLFGFDYNFQSGFGNWNDTADSIGSLFGMGPEDRESVLNKADKITSDFFQKILNLYNTGQYDQAIQKLDAEILKNQNLAKKYKSSNSKAKHNKIANDLTSLKSTLKKPIIDTSNILESSTKINKTLKSNSSIIFGLGFLFVVLKYTKILK